MTIRARVPDEIAFQLESLRDQRYGRGHLRFVRRARVFELRAQERSADRAGVGSPLRVRQISPIPRSIAGYTSRCRNGVIAAM